MQINSRTTERLRRTILDNAAEIVCLRTSVREAFARRSESAQMWKAWEQASAELSARYDSLAFPRGLNGAFERIDSGDPDTVEAALCFLETRPYFFCSGYIFKDILRRCKRASLSSEQAARLAVVMERAAEWRRHKSSMGSSQS
jgi:hypothetical protein